MKLALLLAATCHAVGPLPDPACSPGAVDPRVTQANVQTTICRLGYTRTVRPPLSVSSHLKRERKAAYGLLDSSTRYELDHLIPLELGGHPTDVRNLWPERFLPRPGAYEKDEVENFLNVEICTGRMSLKEAQREIATNWVAVYRRLHAARSQR
jgi:hypothetical protein